MQLVANIRTTFAYVLCCRACAWSGLASVHWPDDSTCGHATPTHGGWLDPAAAVRAEGCTGPELVARAHPSGEEDTQESG